jgi:hypothetical protein
VGCSTTTSPGDGEGFSYPLNPGSTWEYEGYAEMFNWQPHKAFLAARGETLATYRCTAEVTGVVVLPDSTRAMEMRELLEETAPWGEVTYYEGRSYYTNQEDGLYLHAVIRWAGFVAPKVPARAGLFTDRVGLLASFRLAAVQAPLGQAHPESLVMLDPPVRSLAYPLDVGTTWTTLDEAGLWRQDRVVLDPISVEVPAGEFRCRVIQTLDDWGYDGQWDDNSYLYDYVSDEGLVARSLLYVGLPITDEHGDTLGTYDTRTEFRLVEFDLAE